MFDESLGQAAGRSRLQGRRILVVGAGQRPTPPGESVPVGNGRAMALLFAREGAAVACVDHNEEALGATVDAIAAERGTAIAALCDVRDAEALVTMVDRCAEALGGLDGVALNVGISRGLRFGQLNAPDWDDEFAVNLRSHALIAQAALPKLSAGSAMVLVSSLAALRNTGRNPAYEASKAAQVSLARAIAVAGEPQGIRCNAVLPGLMDTPMGRDATRRRPDRAVDVPFGRQGTGWEVAYASLFLLSHESAYVNGHALVVDGGLAHGVVRRAPPAT